MRSSPDSSAPIVAPTRGGVEVLPREPGEALPLGLEVAERAGLHVVGLDADPARDGRGGGVGHAPHATDSRAVARPAASVAGGGLPELERHALVVEAAGVAAGGVDRLVEHRAAELAHAGRGGA